MDPNQEPLPTRLFLGTFWLCVAAALVLGMDATSTIAYIFIAVTGVIVLGWAVFAAAYAVSPVFRARIDHRRHRSDAARSAKAQAVADRKESRDAAVRQRYEAERARLSATDRDQES